MIDLIAVLASIYALVLGVSSLKAPRFVGMIHAAGWVVLAAALTVSFLGYVSGPMVLAVCAALAVMVAGPLVNRHSSLLPAWMGLSILVPTWLWSNGSWAEPGHETMLVAFACAVAASVVAWANLGQRAHGLIATGAAAGALAIGFSRNVVLSKGYHLPLADDRGAIFWKLAPSERLPEGIRLLATGPALEWMVGAMILTVVSGLVVFGAHSFQRVRMAAATVGAVSTGAVIFGLTGIRAGGLPPATAYQEYTQRLLLSRQATGANSASFDVVGQISVDTHAMVPELILWTAAMGFLVFSIRPKLTENKSSALEKAAVISWSAWFVALLVHTNITGTPGVHSASEWMLLGCVLAGTACAAAAQISGRFGDLSARVGPALVAIMWLLGIAVSWVFRSPLGLSFAL